MHNKKFKKKLLSIPDLPEQALSKGLPASKCASNGYFLSFDADIRCASLTQSLLRTNGRKLLRTRSRTCPGLSLIEALISIAVVTLIMSPIFVINNQIIRGVSRYSDAISRTLEAKTFLIDAAFVVGADATEHVTQFEKRVSFPKTFMRYERKKIDKQSSLGALTDVYAHQVSLRWQDQSGVPRTDTLITYVFQPTPQKDKK